MHLHPLRVGDAFLRGPGMRLSGSARENAAAAYMRTLCMRLTRFCPLTLLPLLSIYPRPPPVRFLSGKSTR